MMVYQRNADGASLTNHQLGSRRRGRWETPSANRTLLPRGKFDLPCDKQSFNSIISISKDRSHECLGGHLGERDPIFFLLLSTLYRSTCFGNFWRSTRDFTTTSAADILRTQPETMRVYIFRTPYEVRGVLYGYLLLLDNYCTTKK